VTLHYPDLVANLIFNVMKGAWAYYGTLPAASDGLTLVPLVSAGLVNDATMRDYTTLAAILAANTESNIGRKALTDVTVTVDQTNDVVLLDCSDFSWLAATAGAAVGAVVICYVPIVGTSPDSAVIPISKHDVNFTPAGNDVNVTIATGGFAQAA
jgi:hypothetical protein